MDELQKRKKHFEWVAEQLSKPDKVFYIEKDWYDDPTLITKEDAKKEVEQIELELQLKNICRPMLRIIHQ